MEPITRKEMFLAAAGGQNVETPTPVTREEVLLNEIAKGGGSSGGGVLVTLTESGGKHVADKTAGEIYSVVSGGGCVIFHYTDSYGADTYDIMRGLSIDESGYYMSMVSGGIYLFSATADGYPAEE